MSSSVSVFGLGYVGCVTAACLAREGHTVIGVDVNAGKVEMVRAGTATIVENGIGELVDEMVKAGRLTATTSVADAVAQSQISLVCVGTPSQANGGLDLVYARRVAAEIGAALKDKSDWHVVVIRSTVLPGTTRDIITPILEQASGKKAGQDFGVSMNPEFLREGTSIRDFDDPPFTVIGAEDDRTAKTVGSLYAGLDAPVRVVPLAVAEMVKYACNSFHGLKVAFGNEIGSICKALNVDSHEVMKIFCEDTKLNIAPTYLRPGFAFGGSCLPKDLRALSYRARQLDVDTPVLTAALSSNEKQIGRAFEMVRATGCRKVGVLGLAFKAGTDDLRESPIVTLVERLIGKGMQLAIYDGHVSHANVIGANRDYIENEIPHIWSLMRDSVKDVVDFGDVVVIGNGTPEFRDIQPQLRDGQLVVDLVRAFGTRTSDSSYHGVAW
ncbi:MAG: GDP-mannose dehydrogenase [Gemmatimonadetes bacterium]|jgi:GDP-mannose 6-dehydrogenase|nr:GDP-mannose dehydrogenase [Gemmatimonadota bacterium]